MARFINTADEGDAVQRIIPHLDQGMGEIPTAEYADKHGKEEKEDENYDLADQQLHMSAGKDPVLQQAIIAEKRLQHLDKWRGQEVEHKLDDNQRQSQGQENHETGKKILFHNDYRYSRSTRISSP